MLLADFKTIKQRIFLNEYFSLFNGPLGLMDFGAIQLSPFTLTIKTIEFGGPYFERIFIPIADLAIFVSSLKGTIIHLMGVENG